MLWIHYLVGNSHFAECCENRPVTLREMLINLLTIKSLNSRMVREVAKLSAIRIRDRSPSKVNQFFRLVGLLITPGFNEIGSLLLQ